MLASTVATAAVRTNTTASHSGRVIHQAKLLGSGSAMPVVMLSMALMPAIARRIGMCQR